jgi:hypothetical protein
LIERDIDIVPCLIERHHVLIQVDDLLDVLVIVVPPDEVMLLDLNIVDLLFRPEVSKMGLIHV